MHLFRMFAGLPFDNMLENFAKVYNAVFIREIAGQHKYQLMEIQHIEKWELDDFQVCFRHNFSNNTSRQVNYLNSSKYIDFVKGVTTFIKRVDMENQTDFDLHGHHNLDKKKDAVYLKRDKTL